MAIVQDAIEGMPAVNIDDQGGARAAMQHVLAHGHREILILAIRSGKYGRYEQYAGTLRDRMQGYREALNAHGLDVDRRQVRLMECSSTEKGGRQVFRKVLKSGWRPSAVVAMSDIIAIGVMREALEAGLRVPADLSIAGFDDIPLSAWVNPPLTTVAQPLQKKGRPAAEILLQTIEGQSDPRHHVLPTKLVARKSVPAPPGS